MTDKPFRNEESTIVHELTHLLLWKFDMFSEKVILKKGWICSNQAWILATKETPILLAISICVNPDTFWIIFSFSLIFMPPL